MIQGHWIIFRELARTIIISANFIAVHAILSIVVVRQVHLLIVSEVASHRLKQVVVSQVLTVQVVIVVLSRVFQLLKRLCAAHYNVESEIVVAKLL